jgi:D-amino-acid oxidase
MTLGSAAASLSTPSAEALWEASRRELLGDRRTRRKLRVVVVGGGIAGLEAARELRACGIRDITVYEDRPVRETPSFVAAGLIEPVAGARDPAGAMLEARLFARSMPAWAYMRRTAPHLVSIREVDTYCSTERPPLSWADDVHGFRQLRPDELHPAYRNGEAARFQTYVVETPRFLAALRARLGMVGVKFVRRRILDLAEIVDTDAVVNASGLGAAALAGDETMFRGDGHVITVLPVEGVERVFIDETRDVVATASDPFGTNMIYVIPRKLDIVIGGTLWDNRDTTTLPEPVPGMPKHLLEVAQTVEPRLAHASIKAYRVASRPRRQAGIRVELDTTRHVPVVHCYGQGGSGWTLAPALAEEAIGHLARATWAVAAS